MILESMIKLLGVNLEENLTDDWYLHFSFFIQVGELLVIRYQLSGFSSEFQPLSSEISKPELQQLGEFRSEASLWFSEESPLSIGDSEVRHQILTVLRS